MTKIRIYAEGPAVDVEYWVDDVEMVHVGTPSSSPTSAPSRAPTKAPSTSIYGNGPFVTLATSSEVVTIPRPPVPPGLDDPRTNCPHDETNLLSWHDGGTWTSSSGQVPTSGDVTLPENSKIIISQSITEELGVITIPSTSELIFGEDDTNPITLDIAGMDVQGAIRAGSGTCPYLTDLTITLHGSRPTDFNIYGLSSTATPTYKGISVNGGILSMHGKRYFPTWTRLAESVAIGQTYLLVQEDVNWEVGQQIVVTTTALHDSRSWHQNEVLTISSIDHLPDLVGIGPVGAAVHFTNTPTAYAHIANNGYQAEVGLLTRNIKIQGAADDSEPTDTDSCDATGAYHHGSSEAVCPNTYKTGFGGHIIIHNGARGYMSGVELYRMGQTNAHGRCKYGALSVISCFCL